MALLQGAVVLSALATVQPERCQCAQHLWQLHSQKHYLKDRSQDGQSGVQDAITGSAAEQ